MTELEERFESLRRARLPELWTEIEGREPRSSVEPSSARRAVVAVVAFVVSIAGVGFAAVAFGGSERPLYRARLGRSAARTDRSTSASAAERREPHRDVEPDGTVGTSCSRRRPMRIARIAWSPDGRGIAFQNFLDAEHGILTANPDGSDAVRLTDGVNDAWPSWSPDGTKIVFSSTRYDPRSSSAPRRAESPVSDGHLRRWMPTARTSSRLTDAGSPSTGRGGRPTGVGSRSCAKHRGPTPLRRHLHHEPRRDGRPPGVDR